MTTRSRPDSGFSLVELMVALTITVVISGSVYALMAGGQSAFVREPELTDRQQNIRIAMNLLEEDLWSAGDGVPYEGQIFTDGLNGAGIPGALAAATNSDYLEFVKADPGCPVQRICDPAAVTTAVGAGTVVTREPAPTTALTPQCAPPVGRFVMLGNDKFFSLHQVRGAPAATVCPAGGTAANGRFALAAPVRPPVADVSDPFLYVAQLVRYELLPGPDGIPDLWRSVTGRFDNAGALTPPPGGNWQLVARGIDDLQVQYLNANGPWGDTPGLLACATPGTCTPAEEQLWIRSVRITLSARAILQRTGPGETAAAGAGGVALRGQATTVVSVRSTLTGRRVDNKAL